MPLHVARYTIRRSRRPCSGRLPQLRTCRHLNVTLASGPKSSLPFRAGRTTEFKGQKSGVSPRRHPAFVFYEGSCHDELRAHGINGKQAPAVEESLRGAGRAPDERFLERRSSRSGRLRAGARLRLRPHPSARGAGAARLLSTLGSARAALAQCHASDRPGAADPTIATRGGRRKNHSESWRINWSVG